MVDLSVCPGDQRIRLHFPGFGLALQDGNRGNRVFLVFKFRTLLSLLRMYGENFPVKRALVSGDACPAGVMEELEKALGSRLYPHYGSRECSLGGAVTCPAFEGMHLRENHIIPEIIDESGNVLPDGEYGELVLTTIGADAMPLIRYRTGDFTRILPPCKCGGVTKRLDTVSRREGELSMEELDSRLFRIPELVDYRLKYSL